MADPGSSKKSLPTLVNLDIEYTEGGSSPTFNSKGRSAIASLTNEPTNADLFVALAHDGTMGSLNTFLDRAQPSVGIAALFCYILLGVVLITLFFVLPLIAFGFRRYTATVSLGAWLGCEVFLLACASIQLMCLLTMVTTWYGMSDGLGAKLPEAYGWTFELLQNFTGVVVGQLKSAASPTRQKALDAIATTTLNGIKTLRGNLSAWEARFEGYEALKRTLTGPVPVIHMIVLGVALAVVVASASVAIVTWKRRKAALEAGKRSPIFVAIIAFSGGVLQLAHMAMALSLIARWLPLCVLTETYVCAPYREGAYAVLDDGAVRAWPLANRPDPFCRMVPSKLASSCTVKDKVGIGQLSSCPEKGAKRALTIRDSDAEEEVGSPLARWNNFPSQRAEVPGKDQDKPKGDCFFPYKVVDTDMAAACPLFTDDLVAHWMALVICTMLGILTVLALSTIGAIYMAVGVKAKKASKAASRKKRRIKRKKKSKTKKSKRKKKARKEDSKDKTNETSSPAPALLPPESATTPPPPTLIRIARSLLDFEKRVPFPVPVPIPVQTTQKRHRRQSEAGPSVIVLPPPPCFTRLRPPFMSSPLLTPPAFLPQPATPGTSTLGFPVPFGSLGATVPTVLRSTVRHLPIAPCIHSRNGGASRTPTTGKVRRWSIATETPAQRMPELVYSPATRPASPRPLGLSPERGPLTTTSSTTVAFASSRTGSGGAGNTPKVTRFAACTEQRPT